MAPRKDDGKDDIPIEMVSLLDQSMEQDEGFTRDEVYTSKGWIEDVEWKGKKVKTYPLDYNKVGLVRMQIVTNLIVFLVFGLNDQTTGSLIPTLTRSYGISKVVVSNIFLVQVFGYVLACLLNEKLHKRWGMRGAVNLSAGLFILFFAVLALQPSSFFIYMACYLPIGFALGILDSTGNVLIGNLEHHKNEWMGAIHGLYGAASMVTPPVVSHFVKYGRWANFFCIPLGLSVLALAIAVPAFRHETAAKYDYVCNVNEVETELVEEDKSGGLTVVALLKNPAVSLYAIYLFVYLGAEVSTGSWLFSYLLSTKSDDKIAMSYVTSSYWTGLTVGRFLLGFITKRVFASEYVASLAYSLMCLFFYSVLLAVGTINTDAGWYIVVLFFVLFFCGVFVGPLFPNASIVAMQVLPRHLHVGGVGLAVAIGGSGNALLPYLVGVTLHFAGMNWFPLLCWTMVVGFTLIWSIYPKYLPIPLHTYFRHELDTIS
ncbi:hypothetical protein HG536_0E02550 [Torulaspora globosa]|uniref:Major facilitator superfamily (MFS) profile domain-containing protein n=1 Tax=Torulaspora globosa TaxID=48254 RepID=A0A7G3ZIK8_9SACH|nr:uncharacterized protein HG536_0E02550 [Torulaspora globosa]QLL33344.1 hypothetical protein HG536_0E02550 [Torulaspora globosa]